MLNFVLLVFDVNVSKAFGEPTLDGIIGAEEVERFLKALRKADQSARGQRLSTQSCQIFSRCIRDRKIFFDPLNAGIYERSKLKVGARRRVRGPEFEVEL